MNIADFYQDRFITSVYGEARDGGRTHRGVDFSHGSSPGRIAVPAARPGIVVGKRRPSSDHGFGNGIIIRSILDDGNEWDISYNHGHYFPDQPVGSYVQAGEIILHEGTTGWTNGSCVHIEQERAGAGWYTDPAEEMLRVGRRVGLAIAPIAFSNRRKRPTANSEMSGAPLAPGAAGTFVGIVRGQEVEGNPWWIQGYSGAWFWAGAFRAEDIERLRNA